jgi:Protein of unknown function (DUF3224)
MNCRACGTPLPEGATHCPWCGAATPYSSAATEASPDDPTVASPPETAAPLRLPAHVSGSPPYHNPYESYQAAPLAPPPPSPQRRGKRIGLIVGAVLLILLLIGGGVFVWIEYATGSNGAAAAQAHATATASAQARSQPFPAKGTATGVSSTTTKVVQDGSNKISRITEQWVISGDITGSFTDEETSLLHPDKTATSSGMATCTCTVAGKSGTLMWSFTDMGTADGSYQGQFFDFQGTGDLAKLHGQGTFQGQGSHATYATELYFDA